MKRVLGAETRVEYAWVEGEVIAYFPDEPNNIGKGPTIEFAVGVLLLKFLSASERPRERIVFYVDEKKAFVEEPVLALVG